MKDDAQLIEAAREGDKPAYGALVERHQDRLFNALVQLTGSADDARDVAQDAFIQAWLKLDSFRGAAAFYTWLYRIAFNLAMSKKRKKRPTQSIDAAREIAGVEPIDPGAGPEARIANAETVMEVRAALDRLHDDHRQVLVLREIEDCDYETIANILKIPIGTVRSRLFRARMALRDEMIAAQSAPEK